jgi:hypothetical protein
MEMLPDSYNSKATIDTCALIIAVVQDLVDDREAVQLNVIEREHSIELRLRVAEADLGNIIGAHGRTARALRTILRGISIKHGQRMELDIEAASSKD